MSMATKPEDRRTVRTKKLLRQALLELIEEKGIDRITVRDLTDRAEINRGTFYLHYQDVPDLLDKIKEEVFAGLQAIISRMYIIRLMAETNEDKPYEVIVELFEYLGEHADFFRVLLSPKGDISLALRIKDMMARQMMAKLEIWQPREELMLVSREWLIAYTTSSNIGIIQHWFASGQALSPYEIALVMTRLVKNGPARSINVEHLSPPEK
ncbi:TetR/AcrR family transcriptional regulator [Cohnella nanjingensis]|uniref:TetR/AcrR family transcriptional regulator n=1 Tax=Cohnella nanjingensis TaxID=1387779 RepID=A0A7X0RX48_9BACL|nr:TetR/AcrR family transcriptional regulator [Cohnella nanjingensis]MBB6675200.1 TetR/AcrR family transcriptional regulator [Cohnella nanjingensis]